MCGNISFLLLDTHPTPTHLSHEVDVQNFCVYFNHGLGKKDQKYHNHLATSSWDLLANRPLDQSTTRTKGKYYSLLQIPAKKGRLSEIISSHAVKLIVTSKLKEALSPLSWQFDCSVFMEHCQIIYSNFRGKSEVQRNFNHCSEIFLMPQGGVDEAVVSQGTEQLQRLR